MKETHIQRRKLLSLLLLGGLSVTACARENSDNAKTQSAKAQSAKAQSANGRSIIIIGAGLAGLAAARELRSKGYEVLILEGRERIGGRIWTSDKWKDIPLDMGASWIHGTTNNPLSEIADEIGAQRIVTSYENSVIYDTNGQELSPIGHAKIASIRGQIEEILDKARWGRDTDVLSAIEKSNLVSQLSGPERDYIDFILSSEMEQEYGGGAHELSAHYWDSASEFDGQDVLFAKGFSQITNFLAEGLKIELGQVVKEIDWAGESVKVTSQNRVFYADKIILTVPLGVLKNSSIKFLPELPKRKKEAIANLGMGVLNKCYLKFAEVFWPKDIDWIEYVPKTHGLFSEWVSFKNAANFPTLLGFNAAQSGRTLEAMSDKETIESAMQTLKAMFGNDIPMPIDYQITRWAKDPFSFGSYSFNKIGSNPKDRDALFAPIDERLFFAGEAAQKDYFGTAHGAYISGIDASREILESLNL